uniref:Ribosome-recycling factor, mitochondrial n=1 Tax=Meloidogyne enterolobii TaxID=390850 RepID=A0A6V7TTW6_MELEN|nr:unnamed protein product [Meloidogyne enterolobii]
MIRSIRSNNLLFACRAILNLNFAQNFNQNQLIILKNYGTKFNQSSKSKQKMNTLREMDDVEEVVKEGKLSTIGLAQKANKELKDCYQILQENIAKHLTLEVNLKTYEDIPVTLQNGETHKLFKFARITMRNPTTIAINFVDNLEAMKSARTALQSTVGQNVNIQADGFMLYVPVPKITRERREEIANKVGAALIKEYKQALQQIYSKYSRLITDSTKKEDLPIRLNNGLLAEMRKLSQEGEKRCKERSKALLSEVL